MKDRRDPLAKERFLEGNRQRWCLVILALDVFVLLLDACGVVSNPSIYLGAFTTVGTIFIVGASVDSVSKIHRSSHQSISTTSKSESVSKIEITGEQVQEFYVQNKHDESYRPPHTLAEEYR